MRKLLLASAAVLGASAALAGYASAQGLPIDPSSGRLVVQPATGGGANNNNNYQGPMLKGSVANPTPGSMVIHFYGKVQTSFVAGWSSLDSIGGYKVQPQGMQSYMRLYPGVDAMATNGLRYGAGIELRQNFGTGATNSSSSTQFASTGSSAFTSGSTVFVRRAFVYAGTDHVGIIRMGQADGLIGIYDNGVTTFQFQPSGNLNNAEAEYAGVPSSNGIPFAFAGQAGNEYGNNKVVYMSPQFAGFDVGLQYAPNLQNSEYTGCGAANTGGAADVCPSLSSAPTVQARGINQFAAGIRYQGKFGPVGLLAYGVYLGSGHVKYTGAPGPQTYDDMRLGSFGVAVTVAGLTVGGNVIHGAVNGQLALRPHGGVNETGVLLGAKYAFGPVTVGVVGESIDSQGSPGLVGISQRHEAAIDTGVNYAIAPGLTLWGEYMYQTRHQGKFDFSTGATGTAYNNVQSQAALVGAAMTW